MVRKPTYEELEQKVKELEREALERKQAEEELRESERFLQDVFDAIKEGISVLDLNLKIVRVNSWMEEMYSKEGKFAGRKCYEVYQKRDTPCPWCPSLKTIETGEIHNAIVPYPSKENPTGWIDLSSFPLRNIEGNIVGVIEYVKDITQQKRAEEALRIEKDNLRNIFESMEDGVYILNQEYDIQYVNPVLIKDFGPYEGIKCYRYFHDRDEVCPWCKNQDVWAGKTMRWEWYSFKNERTYDLIDSPMTLPDGSTGKLEIFRDISEQKQAKEALRESEERYRELINSITDFIYSHDLEGRFITVNRAAAKTLGYVPEDLIGRPISDFMLPEYRQAFKEEYLQQIKEKGSTDGVTIYLAKDRSKHYIEYRSVLVKQEGMEPFISGSGRDITEKVFSERKMQRLQEQLQRSQKMEALGLMAGGIAHDLNNILMGIVSYPDLLLMDLPEDSPLRKPIEIIQNSGQRAAAVVSDLLTVARGVATGKEVLNLNTVIEEYLQSPEHKKLATMRPSITFKTQLDSDLLNISCSSSHIKKSLMNLITNASEAIEDRGNVIVSTINMYLDEPVKGYEDIRRGEYAVMTVSDDSSGISSDDLERIFEPFYTKKVMGRSGTGLGLAVVWNTVQDHEGYINVKTGEDGTTFELYFPITRDEVTAEEGQVPIEDYMGHGEKILVVDDEENQRDIACGLLAKLGYTTEAVSSGEEAIEYLKDNSADLLVLDMLMDPGIDGLETYKRILELHPGQKAIIASGFSETDRVKEAQRLGAGKYIKKPYTLEKIGLAVKEELDPALSKR